MSLWDEYIDAGSYSLLACHMMVRQYRYHSGPVSCRTRSRTTPRHSSSSNTSSKETSKTFPSSGSFLSSPRRVAKRTASNSLCQRRLKLKSCLERKVASEESRSKKIGTKMQLRQLQVTDRGSLVELPAPRSRYIKTPEDMAQDRWDALPGESLLRSVERVWSDEEMDHEFALLPGEEREEDVEFQQQEDVEEGEFNDELALDMLAAGMDVEGVWKTVQCEPGLNEVEVAAQWAMREGTLTRKRRESAVMDPVCVDIVKSVWGKSER
ncbi:hypothetical protein J1614_003237 [Plenodomus biglobosus]|nr:hypothetical protein J1614_003237 [Plenodomus biglobosus]